MRFRVFLNKIGFLNKIPGNQKKVYLGKRFGGLLNKTRVPKSPLTWSVYG